MRDNDFGTSAMRAKAVKPKEARPLPSPTEVERIAEMTGAVNLRDKPHTTWPHRFKVTCNAKRFEVKIETSSAVLTRQIALNLLSSRTISHKSEISCKPNLILIKQTCRVTPRIPEILP